MSVVGFIGLGNMGAHMARNLMKNGHKLIIYDVVAKPMQELKADGADLAKHPADVAAAAKNIVTMLPSSPHVRSVYTGDNGIFKTIQKGALCMDSSTIDQAVSIEMSTLAKQKGAAYMDTPVSGGVVAAQNALLTFMCGGEVDSFARAEPFLNKMGKNVVHCGAVGTGQAAKICNNMLLGISMIGVSETMNLGEKLGLKPEMLAKIINTSSGRCWSSDTYNPVPGVIDGIPSCRGYAGGFGSSLMAKDLGLAQNAATEAKVSTPLGSLAHQIYRLLAQSPEFQGKDFSVVYQFLKAQQSAGSK